MVDIAAVAMPAEDGFMSYVCAQVSGIAYESGYGDLMTIRTKKH
jgi:hypothetical protein